MDLRYFIFLFCFAFSSAALGQQLDHKQGELLIRLSPDSKIEELVNHYESKYKSQSSLKYKLLVPHLNIWQVYFDFTELDERSLKQNLWLAEKVSQIQYNNLITSRALLPNDPLFEDQWHHLNVLLNGNPEADLDSDLAWDISTGGLTPQGDTIVIAVIDNGINIEHKDLKNQLWINHAEIPDNGIDDDDNGYVDDYLGYNSLEENGNITGGNHGSGIAGIIGAKGNNNLGVTGINWNSKMMIIKNNFNTTEANVLASYGYAYNMRRMYNLSNGVEGAFVVATNSSWGRDFGQPESAPLWCEFYDELGKQGIVNCAATTNMNLNVETDGDLPTACTSEFLVTVTNLNSLGEKVKDAGFGSQSIDLGSFGEGVFTTTENGYGVMNGTSAACPMATGLIGLLYAAPCNNLTAIAKSNPQAAANFVVDYMLNGTKENLSLQGITKTGGQINLYNSLIQMMDDCAECSLPTGFSTSTKSQNEQTFTWTAFNSSLAVNLQYKATAESSFNTILNIEPPYILDGLQACTDYDFQLESICGDTTSSYTTLGQFKTPGCCENPQSIQLEIQSEDQVFIVWPSADLVLAYTYRFRFVDNENWTQGDTIIDNFVELSNLFSCSDYLFQVRAICAGEEELPWSEFDFSTLGCGICTEGTYCQVSGLSTASEWIESIQIDNVDLKTGDNHGYFSHENAEINLAIEGSYPIKVTHGFANQALPQQVYIWLDLNQNSEFESSELMSSSPVFEERWETRLTIPLSAKIGQTKLRIAQSWVEDEMNPKEISPCMDILFGEIEDICISINEEKSPCDNAIGNVNIVSTDLNSAIINWEAIADASEYMIKYRSVGASDFDSLYTDQSQAIINGLDVCILYEVSVTPLCNGISSDASLPQLFSTECNPLDAVDELTPSNFEVMQNPFHEEINVRFNKAQDIQSVNLYSVNGHTIEPLKTTFYPQSISIRNLNHLQAGIYLLRLQTLEGFAVIKLVKV